MDNALFDTADIAAGRARWAEMAESLKEELNHRIVPAQNFIRLIADESAYQGFAAENAGSAADMAQYEWGNNAAFMLDFGEHLTGYPEFTMRISGGTCDSPLSLRLVFAEMPFELNCDSANFRGGLSKGWLQEEFVKIDHIPSTYRLYRRVAARYLKVEVIATPKKVVFDRITFDAVSAAGALPAPPENLPELEKSIFTVGCRTLRECMQTCFEDGPKRDRRLWLGDLYLQAKVNAATFRNAKLVERSIALLAANCTDSGMLTASAYEYPGMHSGSLIPDYTLLFTPLLLEHLRSYGNRRFVEEFYPLAIRQFDIFRRFIDEKSCQVQITRDYWFFIDHCPELSRETPEFCVYLFALKKAAELAAELGRDADTAKFLDEYAYWHKRLLAAALDTESGMLISGKERQISEASQIWGVLSGVLDAAEGRRALQAVRTCPGAIRSRNPYLLHYLLEAYTLCGEPEKARALIRDYWGKMIALGADTFWEIFDPDNLKQELYGDPFLISACHAWSCTPVIFLLDK